MVIGVSINCVHGDGDDDRRCNGRAVIGGNGVDDAVADDGHRSWNGDDCGTVAAATVDGENVAGGERAADNYHHSWQVAAVAEHLRLSLLRNYRRYHCYYCYGVTIPMTIDPVMVLVVRMMELFGIRYYHNADGHHHLENKCSCPLHWSFVRYLYHCSCHWNGNLLEEHFLIQLSRLKICITYQECIDDHDH